MPVIADPPRPGSLSLSFRTCSGLTHGVDYAVDANLGFGCE
jgi:hypothetical protein